jgi:RNA polymerase sigma-70 factor, ECF subfamily
VVAVEGMVEVNQQRRRLQQILSGLPLEQRRVLALAYYQGLTQQEIAEILHEPLGTVKTRTRLGLQKLRSLLAAENGFSE